ncbi:hypothetical protein [Methanobrevibacter sp. UBA313]
MKSSTFLSNSATLYGGAISTLTVILTVMYFYIILHQKVIV